MIGEGREGGYIPYVEKEGGCYRGRRRHQATFLHGSVTASSVLELSGFSSPAMLSRRISDGRSEERSVLYARISSPLALVVSNMPYVRRESPGFQWSLG